MTGIAALPAVKWEIGLSGPTTDPSYFRVGDPLRGVVGTNAVAPDDIWSDITSKVRSWSLRRGAARDDGPGPVRYEAGTLTLELNNGDRAFDPTNLSGPYTSAGVSLLTPMVRVRGTATYQGVPYRLITALADAWTPGYPAPTWSVVLLTASDASKVFAAQDRAASAPAGASENAGARIGRVLNSLGWPVEDRSLDTGDTTLQATTLQGNGLAELQLTADSEYGEFYLDADGIATFRRRHAILADARSNTAQATFGDGVYLTPVLWDFETGVGAFFGVGATIAASAAQANTGVQSLLMTVSGSPSQAYTRQSASSPVVASQSYTGTFWVYYPAGGTVGAAIDWYNTSGYVSTSSNSAAVPAATWTQLSVTGTAPAGVTLAQFGPTLGSSPANGTQLYLDTMNLANTVAEVPYRDVTIDADDTTMANYVSITRVGGVEQVSQDATSQARNLKKVYSRNDLLMETDTVAADYAAQILYRSKDPEVRFSLLELGVPRPNVAGIAWPAMLGLDFGERVTVIRRPPGGGSPNQADCWVRGIEHASDGGGWTTRFALESAARSQFLTVGHPTLGRAGLNAIAF